MGNPGGNISDVTLAAAASTIWDTHHKRFRGDAFCPMSALVRFMTASRFRVGLPSAVIAVSGGARAKRGCFMRPIQELAAHLWPTFRRHELNMARRVKNGTASKGSPKIDVAHLRFHVQGARYWHLCMLRARRT